MCVAVAARTLRGVVAGAFALPAWLGRGPMLPTPGEPPEGGEWAFEFKWDGMRALVVAGGGGGVRVLSRVGNDVTSTFPEIAALAEVLDAHQVVLDGEVVAWDASGRPDFGRLQARMHRARPDPGLVRRVPVALLLFDLLWVDGVEVLGEPYVRRRERLRELAVTTVGTVRVPEHHIGLTGDRMLAIAAEHDLEGIVAKRLGSPYRPGVRSADWIKTALRHTTHVVIGGWVPGSGTHRHVLGSLIVGVYDERGMLRCAGHVGTGFSENDRAVFGEALDELARPTSPFSDAVPAELARYARWVEPVIVVEVEYRHWTGERRLRHPAFRRVCPDVPPENAVGP
ncbi:hypothetical protein GCM10025787_03160 [Saccharopolyspora rosea]